MVATSTIFFKKDDGRKVAFMYRKKLKILCGFVGLFMVYFADIVYSYGYGYVCL